MNILNIPIANIQTDTEQPRKFFDPETMEHLKNSIMLYGIKIPIIVRPFGSKTDVFTLVDGERRFRASRLVGLKEVPCVLESEVSSSSDILEMQLMLDNTKDKLSSEERDTAIFKLWQMLEQVQPEELGIRVIPNSDWRIGYICTKTGVSNYIVRMAINKEEFKSRNPEFKEKLEKSVKDFKNKATHVEKRFNAALDETARINELKDPKKDDIRKKIVKGFVSQTKTRGDNTIDALTLRSKLKDISSDEDGFSKENVSNLVDDITGKKKSFPAVFSSYIKKINNLTDELVKQFEVNSLSFDPEYTVMLHEVLIDVIFKLEGKVYNLKEIK